MLNDKTEKTGAKKIKRKDTKHTQTNLLNLDWSLEFTTCKTLDCLKSFHCTKKI